MATARRTISELDQSARASSDSTAFTARSFNHRASFIAGWGLVDPRTAEPGPLGEPRRLLMHSRHGVSVLRTLFEAALLELQRGPIELVNQLGMPLPQPFLGQELSGQTLEPRDDPAVVGIHAATPPPRPRGVGSYDAFCCAQPILRPRLRRNTRRYSPPPPARSLPRNMGCAPQHPGTRPGARRPATALRRPAIQYSGGIALHLPRPNTWPLNSQWLGRFRPFSPSDPFRPGVWRVYHIPPDKLRACFDNFRMHSSARRAMAHR